MKKKSGSIMITTLICFSVISIVCVGCIGIVNSNNEIINVNYNSTVMGYKIKGGLELVHSKVLEEVNSAIQQSLISDDFKSFFKNYFLGDNKNHFINNIENINTDNIKINIINDKIYIEDNNIKFDTTCEIKDNDIKKTSKCSFKINLDFDFNEVNLNEIVKKYNYKEI